MASIDIPKRDVAILRSVSELSEKQFDALRSAISEAKPTLTPTQFGRNISKKIKIISPSNILSILRVLFILYSVKQRARMTSQELAKDVSDSVKRSSDSRGKDGALFSPERKKILCDRLTKLLDFESLAVTAKAVDVMTEHGNIFCGARILSDIRPVFASDPESASAAVIIHNLQIGFHHNGEHEEFYVALDTEDIQKMKHLIARAEEKTKALKLILKKSNLDYLEP